MPNLKINNNTYSGVTKVQIPLSDGSGNGEFAYISSAEMEITENGTHDVTHYGSVNVAVPTEGDGITPTGTKTITENGTYDVTEYASANVAIPEVEQATPTISVSTSGLITASATQETGVVPAGTKSKTKQLTTQAARTVTPGTSDQTAVASGRYTTGAVTVEGDANLVPGNIRRGVSIFDVEGTLDSEVTLQTKTVAPSETAQTVTPDSGYDGLSSVSVGAISKTYVGSGVTRKSAQTYTPGVSNQTIDSGQYLNGTQTIEGDANLIDANIKKGVSIFDVLGTYEGESGGSGGGLPSGVKKLVTGTYSPSSDDTNPYVVTHNFGETPTFAMLLLCDDVTTASLKSAKVMQFQFHKRMMAGSALQTMRGAYLYYGSSSTISTGGLSDSAGQYSTTTTVTFMAHSSYPLKAGSTYRWVVGVLDNVVI